MVIYMFWGHCGPKTENISRNLHHCPKARRKGHTKFRCWKYIKMIHFYVFVVRESRYCQICDFVTLFALWYCIRLGMIIFVTKSKMSMGDYCNCSKCLNVQIPKYLKPLNLSQTSCPTLFFCLNSFLIRKRGGCPPFLSILKK
jgi:hypothetical protein